MNNQAEQETFRQLLLQGTRLLKQGRSKKALPLLQRAHEIKPQNPDAALNLSGAYILSGQFKKAIPILEGLREQEPRNAMVWTNLGAAYLGNPVLATDDQQQEAVAAFERALELDPDAPSVAYNIGLIFRDRQDRAKAIRWFRRAVETNPQDRHAQNILEKLLAEEE
ncbi:MAG TPA: tetratricopeptide repeat protein [Candidatus Sulfomarinibacteraceae bacterium]|nr:tetratricopeptide repeat protein [Candidatus Sulfomarinibacteraceae bacterium]